MYKKLVLTHHNCTDGCTSRAIFEEMFKDQAHYVSVDHSELDAQQFPEKNKIFTELLSSQQNSEVFMADICLPYPLIEELLSNGNKVTILDHHASSAPTVEKLKTLNHPNLTIDFEASNQRSGAMIAWQFMHPDTPPPPAVKYVSDGDLYTFNLGDETRYFYQGLNNFGDSPKDRPPEFYMAMLKNQKLVSSMVEGGQLLFQKYQTEVEAYASKAQPIFLNGIEGLFVEAPGKYKSDVGNRLAIRCGTFGAVVEEKADCFTVSLRSIAPFSVQKLAEVFQGGGHPQASAFRLKNRNDWENLISLDHKQVKPRL
jgi:oligoribonuclease NrnB/cAMP/cGMP phosphodiesterase (DHH superfamily)